MRSLGSPACRMTVAGLVAAGVALAGCRRRGWRRKPPMPHEKWSFDGIFGTPDLASAQRGFQVYSEVCANCHAMQQLHYRDLTGLGLNEAEVKAIAATFTVPQGLDDQGSAEGRPRNAGQSVPLAVSEREGGACGQ